VASGVSILLISKILHGEKCNDELAMGIQDVHPVGYHIYTKADVKMLVQCTLIINAVCIVKMYI
jgi:hypothetical protein